MKYDLTLSLWNNYNERWWFHQLPLSQFRTPLMLVPVDVERAASVSLPPHSLSLSLSLYPSTVVSHRSIFRIVVFCGALQHTATRCNTLQHTATYCNTLQHIHQQWLHAVAFSRLMYPEKKECTHCNTLQHTATHCKTSMNRDFTPQRFWGSLKHLLCNPPHPWQTDRYRHRTKFVFFSLGLRQPPPFL